MSDEAKTAISVTTDDPQDQKQPDVPYDMIIGDLTCYREPPANGEEDVDPGTRFEPAEVTPDNYDETLREKWKPRVRLTVRNHLSENADEKLAVDFQPTRRVAHWAAELDEQIPEIHGLLQQIEELDNLQSDLAARRQIRTRLAGLIEDTNSDN